MRWLSHLPRLRRSLQTVRQRPPPRKPRARPQLEGLEERTVLSAVLDLTGTQTLVAGTNVDASFSSGTRESEMQVTINPRNPLQVAGFTHDARNLNQILVYSSDDGGLFWRQAILSSAGDGLGTGKRFDPTLKFDDDGHLFIAYGFDNGDSTSLVVARSDDGGQNFFQFRCPQRSGDVFDEPGLDKCFLTTGLDPTTGRQAVYIAYTWNSRDLFWMDQEITVVGSNDGGDDWTRPCKIDDDDGSIFADPAVGPNGELYVVWHDVENGQLKFDRDLDGLWGNSYGFGDDVVVRDLRENLDHKKTPASPRRGFENGPSIDVSRSWFLYGRIYVAFTDTFLGDDTDVYLATSDNKGSTWHLDHSVLGGGNVEGSSGTDFMATVAVDQATGSVNVGYYTTDGDQFSGNDDVNFRLASSIDGGDSWAWTNLSSATSRASAMENSNEFGDYVGLAAYDGTVRGFWTDNRGLNSEMEAFTATAAFHSATDGNTLIITGTSSADTIEIMTNPLNPDYVTAVVNGQNEFTGLWASLDGIAVYGYGGDDAIFIERAGAGVPITVYGGEGNDTVHIILPAFDAGRISGVQVHGDEGYDSLTLWNDLNPDGLTYTVTGTAVSVAGSSFGGLDYDTAESLTLRAGPGDDTINVNSTGWLVPVTIDAGAGNDAVNVTPTSMSLNDVQGDLTVNGESATDTLVGSNLNNMWILTGSNQGTVGNVAFTSVENLTGGTGSDVFVFGTAAGVLSGVADGGGGANSLDYSHHPTGVTVQLANSPALGTATATGGVRHIQTVYGSRLSDTLIGSDQDDTFLTYGGRDIVRGNGGNDIIHVVGAQDPASTLDGGSGSNLLWPDNTGSNTWTLSGAGAGSVSSSGFANGNALVFTNMQRLLGGRYADTFRVLPDASFSYLSGYAGTNWLDYSAYPSAVTVNLAAHAGTGVAGANLFSFQNVIGSRKAANTLTGDGNALGNILVGGDAADTLTAGTARSILIGGRGADVLTGGKADDIVLGGITDFDQNQAALQAVMGEWLSTTDSYLTRIAKIRAGISSGGSTYALVWGTTVHDDGSADTLRGDPSGSPTTGLDWFFANQDSGTLDTLLDLQPGEKVNNQA
jgi:hypothetical protein